MYQYKCTKCQIDFECKTRKTTENTFCSRSCAASFNNKARPKRKPKIRTCQSCGDHYTFQNGHGSKKNCPNCSAQYLKDIQMNQNRLKQMTLKQMHIEFSQKGKHPSWKNSYLRVLNKSWNKDLVGNPCEVCGYSLHTELAHIKAITAFSEDALLSEVNDSKNIKVLCRNCHWEFDNLKHPIGIEPMSSR